MMLAADAYGGAFMDAYRPEDAGSDVVDSGSVEAMVEDAGDDAEDSATADATRDAMTDACAHRVYALYGGPALCDDDDAGD
jgi:hypothetical protein